MKFKNYLFLFAILLVATIFITGCVSQTTAPTLEKPEQKTETEKNSPLSPLSIEEIINLRRNYELRIDNAQYIGWMKLYNENVDEYCYNNWTEFEVTVKNNNTGKKLNAIPLIVKDTGEKVICRFCMDVSNVDSGESKRKTVYSPCGSDKGSYLSIEESTSIKSYECFKKISEEEIIRINKARVKLFSALIDARVNGFVEDYYFDGFYDEILKVYVDPNKWNNTSYAAKMAFLTFIGKSNLEIDFCADPNESGCYVHIVDYYSNKKLGDFSRIRGSRIHD